MKSVFKLIGIVIGLIILLPLIKVLGEIVFAFDWHLLLVAGLIILAVVIFASLFKN